MTITDRHYDNETNDAIEFAIFHRNQLIAYERNFSLNTFLRERNLTPPTDIIFDIYSENREVIGIVCINDGRYTNRGRKEKTNNVYLVRCLLNNYNGDFLLVGVNTYEEIFDLMKFMKEIVDYEPNSQFDLAYVHIPILYANINLLNIPHSLRMLNINNDPIYLD
jgi:hypothetical protein